MTAPELTLPIAGTEPALSACLYFLVSAASTGTLTGAYKLGVAASFAARYHRHTRTWQERFDLDRSVLLHIDASEVYALEKHLQRLFGRPGPNGQSWRRDPGRKADGYTEWFDLACLEAMLTEAERWVAQRCALGVCAQVSRGLSPAERALVRLAADGSPLPLPLVSQTQRRALAGACWAQEQAIEAARDVAVAGAALEVAQAFEAHLVWVSVDLWRWYETRPTPCPTHTDVGWADLYFGRFGPPRAQPTVRSQNEPPPTPAQLRFEEACRLRLAVAIDQTANSRRQPQGSCRLMDAVRSTATVYYDDSGNTEALGPFPHPFCADSLLLRLTFERCGWVQSFYARYEALARRAESRHRWAQPELW